MSDKEIEVMFKLGRAVGARLMILCSEVAGNTRYSVAEGGGSTWSEADSPSGAIAQAIAGLAAKAESEAERLRAQADLREAAVAQVNGLKAAE